MKKYILIIISTLLTNIVLGQDLINSIIVPLNDNRTIIEKRLDEINKLLNKDASLNKNIITKDNIKNDYDDSGELVQLGIREKILRINLLGIYSDNKQIYARCNIKYKVKDEFCEIEKTLIFDKQNSLRIKNLSILTSLPDKVNKLKINKSVKNKATVNTFTPVTLINNSNTFIPYSFTKSQSIYQIDCNLTTQNLSRQFFSLGSNIDIAKCIFGVDPQTYESDIAVFILDPQWKRIVYSRTGFGDYYDIKAYGYNDDDVYYFERPEALCATEDGTIFVADAGARKIVKFVYNSSSHNLTCSSIESFVDRSYLSNPVDIEYDGGYLFVADIGRHSILIFNASSGAFVDELSTYTQDGQTYNINSPRKICVQAWRLLFIDGNKVIYGDWQDNPLDCINVLEFPPSCNLSDIGYGIYWQFYVADQSMGMIHKINYYGDYVCSYNFSSPSYISKLTWYDQYYYQLPLVISSSWDYSMGVRQYIAGADILKTQVYEEDGYCKINYSFTDDVAYRIKLMKNRDENPIYLNDNQYGGPGYEYFEQKLKYELSSGDYFWRIEYKPYFDDQYGNYAIGLKTIDIPFTVSNVTYLSGEINSNMNLGGNVYITGNTVFKNNSTVNISAGTNVYISPGVGIEVQYGSKIVANGEQNNKINFQCTNSSVGWDGINLLGGTNQLTHCVFKDISSEHTGLTINSNDYSTSNKNIISYCSFENGNNSYGINIVKGRNDFTYCESSNGRLNLSVSNGHNEFTYCCFRNGSAYENVVLDGGSNYYTSCEFRDSPYATGLYISGGSVILNYCQIKNNNGGILNNAGDVQLLGCEIDNNEGTGVTAVNYSSIAVSNNTYISNNLNHGVVITDSYLIFPTGYNSVRDNNGDEIYIEGLSYVSQNGCNVFHDGIYLGDHYIYNCSMTYDNETYSVAIQDFRNNYWGSTTFDPEQIFYGYVLYEPYMTSDPFGSRLSVASLQDLNKDVTTPLQEVITEGIAKALGSSSKVDDYDKMMQVINKINSNGYSPFNARRLKNIYFMNKEMDLKDHPEVNKMVTDLFKNKRENLENYVDKKPIVADSVKKAIKIAGESAILIEIHNLIHNEKYNEADAKIKKAGKYLENLDSKYQLEMNKLEILMRTEKNSEALAQINTLKAFITKYSKGAIKSGYILDILENKLKGEGSNKASNLLAKQTAEEESKKELPKEFLLKPNYPNPFNPTTTIPFMLPEGSNVVIEVYDMTGKLVRELTNNKYNAGEHIVKFDGSNLASGIYLVNARIISNEALGKQYNFTQKIMLMK